MFGWLRCKSGWHFWTDWGEIYYETYYNENGYITENSYRACKRCGIIQEQIDGELQEPEHDEEYLEEFLNELKDK